MIEQDDIIDATFQPVRVDTLKPGLNKWIGRRCRWKALWLITDEDVEHGASEAYLGQYAWTPADETDHRDFPYLWVPTEDLYKHREAV